ncbi:MAG: 7-cyano-7-deazaguanine synthase [Saprospiraceae bacterium]|nr:7-cyano-7-deazaguanine synthase [Saprospiraceae bacterium]
MNRVVLLVSGGIDSTTLLAKLRNEGKEVTAVFFNYGQENIKPTLASAKHYCKLYGAELLVIKIPYSWSKSSVIAGNYVNEKITDKNVYKKDVKAVSWVPARNATMLLIAGGIASERGIADVYCSFQFDSGEWKIYEKLKDKSKFGGADLTPAFIDLINNISPYCFKTKVQFNAPFIDKKYNVYDIVKSGIRLNVNYNKTYSCRYYVNGEKCNNCEQCIIRKKRLTTC